MGCRIPGNAKDALVAAFLFGEKDEVISVLADAVCSEDGAWNGCVPVGLDYADGSSDHLAAATAPFAKSAISATGCS